MVVERPAHHCGDDLVFIRHRPSTPINEVLEFKYQEDWIEEQRRQQDEKIEKERAKVIISKGQLAPEFNLFEIN